MEEKYLGDIISKDGRNLKNIKARVDKGKGIVKKIMNVLEGIPFGKLYFQIAILLRNSLLVSSVLCNSEAWFNLTKSELDLLETVDLELLRSILKVPKSTPKEMLFLELGVMPLREMIRERRLNFLSYILKQGPETMIYRVFETQCKNKTSKDWISTVLSDLEYLELNVTFDDIQKMSKSKWKSEIKKAVRNKSFKILENIKQTHSKVNKLKHQKLEMQPYFLPNRLKCTQEDIQLIFKMRSNITRVKMNMQQIYDTHECSMCMKENETQEHIYKCEEIWKLREKKYEKIIEYEKILTGNVMEKLEIAKIFKENMKIKENIPKPNN